MDSNDGSIPARLGQAQIAARIHAKRLPEIKAARETFRDDRPKRFDDQEVFQLLLQIMDEPIRRFLAVADEPNSGQANDEFFTDSHGCVSFLFVVKQIEIHPPFCFYTEFLTPPCSISSYLLA